MRSIVNNILNLLLLSGLLCPLSLLGQDSLNVRKIEQVNLWTQTTGIRVSGNIVALATQNTTGVIFLDVSDPLHPIEVSQVPIWSIYGMELYDNSLIVSVEDYPLIFGLIRIDLSSPANPIRTELLSGNLNCFAVWGDTLLVGKYDHGILLYDLTNDPLQAPFDSIEAPNVGRLGTIGDKVVGGTTNSLLFYERNSIGHFALDTVVVLNDELNDYIAHDSVLYVTTEHGKFYALTVSDSVTTDFHRDFSFNVGKIDLSGERIYVKAQLESPYYNGQLIVYDISTPSSPDSIGFHSILNFHGDFIALDDTIYASLGDFGFGAYDVSDADSTVTLSVMQRPGEIKDVHVHDSLLFTGNPREYSSLWNISQPGNTEFIRRMFSDEGCVEMTMHGNIAHIGNYDYFEQYDLSDPLNPVNLGFETLPTRTSTIWATSEWDGYIGSAISLMNYGGQEISGYPAFGMHGNDSLLAVASADSVRVLDGLLQIGIVAAPSFDVAMYEGVIYSAGASSGLILIDISDPTTPFILDSIPVPGSTEHLTLSGNVLLTSSRTGGVRLWDVSIPTDPLLIGYYNSGNSVYDAELCGTVAYIADYYRLTVLDCSEALSLINTRPPRQFAVTTVDDSLRFLWWSTNGATSYSVWSSNDPELPEEFYTLETVTTDTFATLPISNESRKLFFVTAERE